MNSLKAIRFLFLLVCITGHLQMMGQSVSYTTVSDNPLDLDKLEINMNGAMAIGVGMDEQLDGYVNFGYELAASYFPIQEKIGAKLNIQRGTDIINSLSYRKTELVGTYTLFSSKRKGQHPLILKAVRSSANTITTTSITTEQTRQTNFEVRGGLVRNSGPLGILWIEDFGVSRWVTYKGTGVLGGIQWRKFHYYAAKADGYGTVAASSMWELYADVMMTPAVKWDVIQSNGTGSGAVQVDYDQGEFRSLVKNAGLASSIGGKIGFRYTESKHHLFTWNGGGEVGRLAPNPSLHFYLYAGLALNFL